MIKEKINQNEGFRSLELQIEPPDPIQGGWKVAFTCEDMALCGAYNVAIKKVLDEHKLMPFYQTGGGYNDPGEHAWEIWKETDEAALRFLFPAMGSEPRKNFDRKNQNGLTPIIETN